MKRIITSLAVVCMYVCMYVCMLTTLTNTNVAFANLKDGLVAYYPFSGNADDESGNGNHGTVNGATLTTDRFGNTNKAYSFDGVDDYISVPELFDSSIQAFTISTWALTKTLDDNWHDLFYKTPSKGEFALSINTDNKFSMGAKLNNATWYFSTGTVNKDTFVHLVGIYDKGNYLALWVDGIEVSKVSIPNNNLIVIGTSYPSAIGAYTYTGFSSFWNGKIDEVRIYNRVLSESEIQELYNEGGSTTPTPTATPTATLVQTPTPTPTVTATVTSTPTPSGTGIVFGYVYDEDENPLRSVTVKIDGDAYSNNATTDEDGYYEFDKVPVGDYTIAYTKTGYETQTMEVTVEEGDAVQADSVTMLVVQKGSIYGYATDIRGNPLESVRLKLVGIGIKAKKTASTDSDGFFEFKDLETGIYRIVAKKRFYKAAQQTVELEEGEDKEIEIEMKKTTKRGMMAGVLD